VTVEHYVIEELDRHVWL